MPVPKKYRRATPGTLRPGAVRGFTQGQWRAGGRVPLSAPFGSPKAEGKTLPGSPVQGGYGQKLLPVAISAVDKLKLDGVDAALTGGLKGLYAVKPGENDIESLWKMCGSRSSKTFKPKKNIPEGSHQYELLKHAEATLGSGNLRMAVMLPEGEDLNEWVAVNTVDFFNQINMLYGTITDFCTEESCPVMSAGPKYEYHWADGTNIKKPIKCSAPKYIDYLMTWVQDQLDDETLFPSKIGVPFPKNFMSVAKTILKRLFRVYAHIYHQHFDPVIQLQEEAHLNTSFKHFIFFVQEFNLIDRRELAPLQELIEKLTSKDR
ncbi:PREDICTED: MOB kinase activator 1B [Haliaeetus leucocephalus]|uniref:MOB kinase activator 1B n=1 Tax=Haliaeetus leucocephalus TaxID=52644 RepID=UPI00053CAD0E|nr:PREDICTED: MOB kinase activator 1B [Haliaeetus leucocephalus]